MFYTVLYLGATYGAVILLLAGLIRFVRRRGSAGRSRWRKAMPLITPTLLLLPLLPYAQVEVQTRLYADTLRPAVRQALQECGDPAGRIVVMRVLAIHGDRASVYVVQPCSSGMNDLQGEVSLTMQLSRRGGRWMLDNWDCPWSDCGGAKGTVFPPYPECRSF